MTEFELETIVIAPAETVGPRGVCFHGEWFRPGETRKVEPKVAAFFRGHGWLDDDVEPSTTPVNIKPEGISSEAAQ